MKFLQFLFLCLCFFQAIQGGSIKRVQSEAMMSDMDVLPLIKLLEERFLSRIRRNLDSPDCSGTLNTRKADSQQCTLEAKEKYLDDMFEDRRDVSALIIRPVPEDYEKDHYYARKTCSYLTTVMQDCFSCLPSHLMAHQRDKIIKQTLKQIELVPKFDSQLCPVIKDYLDRTSRGTSSILAGSAALILLSSTTLLY